VSPTSGGEGGEYHPQTPHSYHGTNPQYHPGSRGRPGDVIGSNSAGNTPIINNDSSFMANAPPLPNSHPPPPASNSMGIISDSPQTNVDTKENKRHTMYNPIPTATTNGVDAPSSGYSPRGGINSHTNGYGGHDSSTERHYETPTPIAPSSQAPVSVDDMDDDTPSNLPPENFGALVSSMIRSSSKDNDNTIDGAGTTSLRMQSHKTSHTKHDNEQGTSTTQETTLAAASISKKVSSTSYSEGYSRRISSVSKKGRSSKDTNSDEENENDDDDDEEEGSKVLADSSIPLSISKSNVVAEKDPITEGEVVSSSTITSRSRTVETTTYSLERDGGEAEQHVEQKVTIQSDGDPIDHDEALAQAIQEATAMNPDMTVEKIEIHQTSAAPDS